MKMKKTFKGATHKRYTIFIDLNRTDIHNPKCDKETWQELYTQYLHYIADIAKLFIFISGSLIHSYPD